jgi:hypothetical protein
VTSGGASGMKKELAKRKLLFHAGIVFSFPQHPGPYSSLIFLR